MATRAKRLTKLSLPQLSLISVRTSGGDRLSQRLFDHGSEFPRGAAAQLPSAVQMTMQMIYEGLRLHDYAYGSPLKFLKKDVSGADRDRRTEIQRAGQIFYQEKTHGCRQI